MQNAYAKNRCATVADFSFHDLKTGGSEIKGLLISKWAEDN